MCSELGKKKITVMGVCFTFMAMAAYIFPLYLHVLYLRLAIYFCSFVIFFDCELHCNYSVQELS